MFSLSKFCVGAFVAALLLSSTTPAVAEEIKGKVKEVYPDRLEFVLTISKGTTQTFLMDEDAEVLINEVPAALVDLRPGDDVTVIFRVEGEYYLAIEVRCVRQDK
jgi:hypothetical protein